MLRFISFLALSLQCFRIRTAGQSGLPPHPDPLPPGEREQQRPAPGAGPLLPARGRAEGPSTALAPDIPLPPPWGRVRERGRDSRPKSLVAIRCGFALAVAFLTQAPPHADEPAFQIDPAVLNDLSARFDTKGLRSVADVLAAPGHPDHDWVRDVHERLVGVGQGSGVVLYRTRQGAAVLLTAAHVLPYEALEPTAAAQQPVRVLFAPPITPQEHAQEVPRDKDFVVALVDDGETTRRAQGWRVIEAGLPGLGGVQAGQEVLLMGAPAVGNLALMYSVGRVLSESEARQHDPQYNADRQFIVQASAAGRMSGGGVFARDGSCVGVITTGYFGGHPKALVSDYVGGGRATWIEARFLAYLARLPEAQRQALAELMR